MKKSILLLVCIITSMIMQKSYAQNSVTITPNAAILCAGSGNTVTLQATPAGGFPISYSWNPGGMTTSTVGVNPGSTTTYTVTVTFAAGLPVTATATATVSVNAPPAPTVSASALSICAGNSVTLTASIPFATAYQWYRNGNPISGATAVSYTDTLGGSYQVLVTINPCSGLSPAVVVTTNPLPVAHVTPAGPLTTCWGTPITLTADPGAGYLFQWQLSTDGGLTWLNLTGETNQTINSNVTGNYRVRVTDTNGCTNNSL